MPAPPLPAPMPLAAGLDWLEGLLPVLFVLFWIVSQVWAVLRRAAAPQRPVGGPAPRMPLPPRPRGDEPAVPAGRVDPLARDELERQIEAFLREAGVRPAKRPDDAQRRVEPRPATRPQPMPASGAGPAPTVTRPPTGATRRPPSTTGVAPTSPPPRDPIAAPQRQASAPKLGGDVARHVDEAFASDLKHRIAPADAGAPPPADRPVDFAAMLRDPEALRRLVVMREILDRPVERW